MVGRKICEESVYEGGEGAGPTASRGVLAAALEALESGSDMMDATVPGRGRPGSLGCVVASVGDVHRGGRGEEHFTTESTENTERGRELRCD